MQAVRLLPGERLKLDGTLSHPAWQRAPVYDRFEEKAPVYGARPPQRTTVQVLFDDRALYVGVQALDDQPALIRKPVVRPDQVNRTQDFIALYIDAIGSKRSAQWFRASAAGSTADGLHTANDDYEDFSPDFDWDAAVTRHDHGYTTVFRVPFASLRYAPGQQQWRIMVVRRLPREHFHLITSVPIPQELPSFIANMQPLQGVTLPADSSFLTLRPSVTLRRVEPEAGSAQTKLSASLDVKWRPLPQAVVDATLNPDFSQVALDVPQLAGNSRFALSFPEKRPFFFESADLLRTPTEAFYTRSFTEPRWGLRGTWRSTDWAGTALALQDRGKGFVLLPGAYGTDVVDQPASTVIALRARSDGTGATLAQGLQLGAVAAARRYTDDRGDNTVLGPDLTWQLNGNWRLRGQWLHGRTTALPDSTGLRKGAEQDGDLLHLRLLHLTDNTEANVAVDDISSGFRHDSGFVNQVGVQKLHLWASRGWNQVGPFNQFWVNAEADRAVDKATGQVVSEYWRPGLWVTGAHNLEWWFEVWGHSLQRPQPTAPLLHERFIATGLVVTPARWFPFLESKLVLGDLADTQALDVRPGGNFKLVTKLRPLAPLEFESSLSTAWLRKDGVKTYSETALQWLAVWHFNARHNLRVIAQQQQQMRRASSQSLVADRSRSDTLSLTYTWRESAGTLLYAGFSSQRDRLPVSSRNTEAFVKLQLDFDEARTMWSRR